MMVFTIGLIIGLTLAFTGAGGGLIAIPLFMTFLNLDIKQASILSLIFVSFSSLLNVIGQRNYLKLHLAFLFIPFTVLGAFIFVPLKAIVPDDLIAGLLIAMSIFSLSVIWFGREVDGKNQTLQYRQKLLAVIMGFFIGGLTTLTGIGGGTLLVPFFILFFCLKRSEAIANSLLTIFVTSTFSLLFQWNGEILISLDTLIFLTLSLLISMLIFKIISSKITEVKLLFARKILFSVIVVYSFLFFLK